MIPGYTVKKNNELEYTIHYDGKEIGGARLSHTKKYIVDVGIYDKEHRRKKLSTELYNHIEKDLGYKLMPSPTYITSDGKSFWKSRG